MARHHDWTDRQTTTQVSVDGHDLDLAYYEAGTDNTGPPVVFLHGIPTWSFVWRDVAPALADDRHVAAVDLVGYGNSASRDGFDRSVRAQEQAVAGLLAHLDADAASLVGHDIGGSVALRYASHNPDSVDELVLSNAACYDSWPVEFVNGLGVPGGVAEWSDDEFHAKLDYVFGDGLYGDPDDEFVAGMKAPWLRDGGPTALERAAVATNTNHTTELDYGAITADVLLLWGGDDVLQPTEYAERLADDVAGDATVVALDRAFHWVVEDRTDAYRDELRGFLA